MVKDLIAATKAARKIARAFSSRHKALDEFSVESAAIWGAKLAVDEYDASKNVGFDSYLKRRVMWEIFRIFPRQSEVEYVQTFGMPLSTDATFADRGDGAHPITLGDMIPSSDDPYNRVEWRDVLGRIDEVNRKIMLGRAAGLTYEGIAECLGQGWTKRKVFHREARARQQILALLA